VHLDLQILTGPFYLYDVTTSSFLDALKYDRVLAQRMKFVKLTSTSIIESTLNLRTVTTR
jgi:hypothetical protein